MADQQEPAPRGRKRRIAGWGLLACVLVLLAALALAYWQRNEIADDLIGDALRDAGVSASYTVETISPELQVLRDVSIGDPARPDFTARRIEVATIPRFGLPGLRQVRVIGGRLYGSYRAGVLSFGQLDPLIFTGEDAPFEWPDLNLAIDDGRGLIESDYGRMGLKLSGAGHLRDGFAGELAVAAPALAAGGCTAAGTTLYGTIAIADEQPHFTGPLRFDRLDCSGATLADGAVQLDAQAARDLTAFQSDFVLRSGSGAFAENRAASLDGKGAFSWRGGVLTARYELAARDVVTPFAGMAELTLAGRASAADGFTRLESEGDVRATGVDLGGDLDAGLAQAASASAGTLAAPLLAKLRSGLARELRGASMAAEFTVRRSGDLTSAVVPQARLRGGSGATLLALSRAQVSMAGDGLPRFAGNFATGGEDMPRIAGRMEQEGRGPLTLNLQMNEYAAGDARLAVPELTLSQGQGGRITLAGEVLASGPLPGGFARGLVLPVDGVIGSDGAVALWDGCRVVQFDQLELASLSLGRQSLRLCPPRGQPILRYGAGGLRIAAGTDALNLRGNLGETPIALASGPIGFAYPGALAARDIAVTLGPDATASRFVVTDLTAEISSTRIGGAFTGTDVFLASVPLDILRAGGAWSYTDGRLDLSGASFTLEDREEVDRFKPLIARDASLSLLDNLVRADAVMRETGTDTAVARVAIAHDLTTAGGHADLFVDGIAFRPDGLQPRDLSESAYGVVSLVNGSVSGTGRIDWTEEAVTSRGEFTSAGLDFAAPFGPVTGASGTVVFTDLIGLTTAPAQRIQIAAINPGIEIYDGEVAFQLTGGQVIDVAGGAWPFLGGTLRLRPVTLNIGVEETRSYVIDIEGLEAGSFVERMDLNNVAATGVFDGTIPIVFDELGNGHLIGGMLVTRPPGGNLSYVGQLTYEDLSYVGNLAFAALRDLRFSRAEILLDGPLTGELVTRVNFEGIGQGETAQGNFITRKIAELPIELRINIRAPFYQLMATTRSLYDPSAVRDPFGLGLLSGDGTRLRTAIDRQAVEEQDARAAAEAEEAERARSNDTDIQPPESEALP